MKTRNQRRTAPRFGNYKEIPDTYVGLCQVYLPRPVHSAAEARAAGQVIAALAGFPLNDEQEDYLDAVSHFADEYDRARQPALPAADGLGVLRHLLEDRGQSGADLARLLGVSRSLGPMILRGERRLTAAHARRLAEHFGLGMEVFLRATRRSPKRG